MCYWQSVSLPLAALLTVQCKLAAYLMSYTIDWVNFVFKSVVDKNLKQ